MSTGRWCSCQVFFPIFSVRMCMYIFETVLGSTGNEQEREIRVTGVYANTKRRQLPERPHLEIYSLHKSVCMLILHHGLPCVCPMRVSRCVCLNNDVIRETTVP